MTHVSSLGFRQLPTLRSPYPTTARLSNLTRTNPRLISKAIMPPRASTASAPQLSDTQRRMAVAGMAQVLFGCVFGLFVPMVTYPRAAVTAHMEFCANGTLQMAMAWATGMMALSPKLLLAYEFLTFVGTWANGGAFVLSAMSGVLSPLAPMMGKQWPPPNGMHGGVHHIVLQLSVLIILALAIGVYGLIKGGALSKRK